MVGLVARASPPCSGVLRVGAEPPPRLVLAEEGPDPAGTRVGAEEAQPRRGRDLPAPSPSWLPQRQVR